ncbi:hypothetical protein [Enterococcus sp. AZ196]|uniref:hypothetical protein n=1 Tax=Enterococcus sp. AZ196 TaxID=2774659 RepID=UPI003D29BD52
MKKINRVNSIGLELVVTIMLCLSPSNWYVAFGATRSSGSVNTELANASSSSIYPSNLDIKNFKGDSLNSGVMEVTKGETVDLNYEISYYGEGDFTLLGVQSSDARGVNIQILNNKDTTGRILISENDEFSDVNIVFSVTGGASSYSQSIRLIDVPENDNENLPPRTNTPEEPANPHLETPEKPVNPATNMPEEPADPATNTPEEPADPATNTPEEPADPATNMPEEPADPATNTPEEPADPATNMPEEPADPATNMPEEPADPATNTPEEPADPATNMPEEPADPATNTPEEPADPATNTPEEPADPATNMPGEPVDTRGKTTDDGKRKRPINEKNKNLSRTEASAAFTRTNDLSRTRIVEYPQTGESSNQQTRVLTILGSLIILFIWMAKRRN